MVYTLRGCISCKGKMCKTGGSHNLHRGECRRVASSTSSSQGGNNHSTEGVRCQPLYYGGLLTLINDIALSFDQSLFYQPSECSGE